MKMRARRRSHLVRRRRLWQIIEAAFKKHYARIETNIMRNNALYDRLVTREKTGAEAPVKKP